MDIQTTSNRLSIAEKTKIPIEPLTNFGNMSIADAYAIQLNQINKKLENDELVGMKIGLTSQVMQEMFNVDSPDFGHILKTMVYKNNSVIEHDKYISPKIEFEIAFILAKDLKGPNITPEQVLEATAYVVPAIEIIDSRIKDWKFKFEDTVADNGSSAGAILGEKRSFTTLHELENIKITARKNGVVFDEGISSSVMGNPANAVAWLANMVAEYNMTLKAGQFILSGAITAAVPYSAGDKFLIDFGKFGQVSIAFKE